MAELKQSMSSREFTTWIAYNQLSPIDPRFRADLDAALIIRMMAVVATRGKKKYGWQEWMPQFQTATAEDEDRRVQRMINLAAIITAANGGQDLREHR